MSRIAVFVALLVAVASLDLGWSSRVLANEPDVMVRFIEAIDRGDLATAQSFMARDAVLTEFQNYDGSITQDRLYLIVANAAQMERIGDYSSVVTSPEGANRTRYRDGFAFWYGEDARLPNTRMIVELVSDGDQIVRVHRYWVGPVPPPVPMMPGSGRN